MRGRTGWVVMALLSILFAIVVVGGIAASVLGTNSTSAHIPKLSNNQILSTR